MEAILRALKAQTVESLISYCKAYNIPFAAGWTKEQFISTIEDALLSRN